MIQEKFEKNRFDRYSMSLAGFSDVSFQGALICGRGATKGSGCDGFVGGWESDAMKFYYDGQITSSFRQFAGKFAK